MVANEFVKSIMESGRQSDRISELLSMYELDKDMMPRKLLIELLDHTLLDPVKVEVVMMSRKGYK